MEIGKRKWKGAAFEAIAVLAGLGGVAGEGDGCGGRFGGGSQVCEDDVVAGFKD